jgi:uncharacterized protein YjiS (DUF1127 family)
MRMLHGSIAPLRYCAGAATAPSSVHRKRNEEQSGFDAGAKNERKRLIMAYVNTTRTGNTSVADRLNGVIASLKAAYALRRIYNRTVYELSGLSDRDLADLGVHRSMIAEIAREAAYGK